MTSEAVTTLAEYLETVDDDWRKANGYTGRAVHRRAYWMNMAARILADSSKTLAQTKKTKCTPTNS
jgi:hypothetical protein